MASENGLTSTLASVMLDALVVTSTPSTPSQITTTSISSSSPFSSSSSSSSSSSNQSSLAHGRTFEAADDLAATRNCSLLHIAPDRMPLTSATVLNITSHDLSTAYPFSQCLQVNHNANSSNLHHRTLVPWLPSQHSNSSTSSSMSFTHLCKEALKLLAAVKEGEDSVPLATSTDGFANQEFCPANWDGASCWLPTLAGREAVIPCFSYFNGVSYDKSQNASRVCLSTGHWAETSNYERCKPIIRSIEDTLGNIEEHFYETNIFYIGHSISLCALLVALCIFWRFKELRCLRNAIHTNLMVTYVLIAIFWITADQLHSLQSEFSKKASCLLVVALRYLMATNFFWMFVEGFILYMVIYNTFQCKQIALWHVSLIGWGIPAVFVFPWVAVKWLHSRPMVDECPLLVDDVFDYIYKVPVLIVLVINIFFLAVIMWILVIKLRPMNGQHWHNSAESKQYRKAARALLVLIPLLGIGYMLVLVTPPQPIARVIFKNLQALLVSTQGFYVAVLYCFFNGEVQTSIKNYFQRRRHNATSPQALNGQRQYYYLSDAMALREQREHNHEQLLTNSNLKGKNKQQAKNKIDAKRMVRKATTKRRTSDLFSFAPSHSPPRDSITTRQSNASDSMQAIRALSSSSQTPQPTANRDSLTTASSSQQVTAA